MSVPSDRNQDRGAIDNIAKKKKKKKKKIVLFCMPSCKAAFT